MLCYVKFSATQHISEDQIPHSTRTGHVIAAHSITLEKHDRKDSSGDKDVGARRELGGEEWIPAALEWSVGLL
jgi:hypothetical protein